MRILFLTPMPQEVQPLLDAHVLDAEFHLPPDLPLYTGKLDTHDLTVGLLGIGKANAAYATTRYINETSPDLIVLFGSGGAVHAGLGHGQLYAAASTWTHDFGAQEPSGFVRWQPGALPIGTPTPPIPQPVGIRLKQAILNAHPDIQWKNIVSGDSFINDAATAADLARAGADIVDMESSVVVDIATKYKLPTLVLRVVSDGADNDAHTDFVESLDQVCERVTPQILSVMRTAAAALG